jgi:hypothetical protein
MNKLFRLLMILLTATAVFACKDDDEIGNGGSATLEINEADKTHSFDIAGGSKAINVTASTMFTVEMAATNWLTVSEISKTGFKINVDENANVESRNVKLTLSVKGGAENIEINVSQPGAPTLTADRQLVEFKSGGGETLVSVNSTTYTATVSGSATWITAAILGTDLQIRTEENSGTEDRSTQITVHVDGFQDVVLTVMQEAYVLPTLSISPRTLEFTSTVREKTVTVTTNRPVYTATVEDGVNWVTTEISGSNLVIKVRSNYVDIRSAIVTVHVEGADDVILTVTQDTPLVGVWTFEDADNLTKATAGADLIAGGGSYISIDGPGSAKAVQPGSGSYYKIVHGIEANGGGMKVNEYTLMLDVRGSAAEFANWLSVLNTRDGNSGEGVVWIDGNGQIGYAALGGYSAPALTPDTWRRVVIAAKLGESLKIFVDGNLAFTATSNYDVDGLMSLPLDGLHIGTDGTNYPGPSFAEIRIWDIQLNDEQIAELGGAQ